MDLHSLSSLLLTLWINKSSYVSLNDSLFSSVVVSLYIHELSLISVEIVSILLSLFIFDLLYYIFHTDSPVNAEDDILCCLGPLNDEGKEFIVPIHIVSLNIEIFRQ
jgi:hypothetical protein